MSRTLFNALLELELPAGDFAIFGSGPLAVREIIPAANDLDVLCGNRAWDAVCALGESEYLPNYGVEVVNLRNGDITFGQTWGIGDFDVSELIQSAELIDGLPFVQLQHVARYKEIRGSDKDQQQLAALREWLLVHRGGN